MDIYNTIIRIAGYSTDLITTNLDKLAATGVRFTQAYAHTVSCPSRAALLLGR